MHTDESCGWCGYSVKEILGRNLLFVLLSYVALFYLPAYVLSLSLSLLPPPPPPPSPPPLFFSLSLLSPSPPLLPLSPSAGAVSSGMSSHNSLSMRLKFHLTPQQIHQIYISKSVYSPYHYWLHINEREIGRANSV